MADKINIAENVKSALCWSLKSYSPDSCVLSKQRTPEEIKNDVFQSKRVQLAIKTIHENSGQSVKDIEKEAKSILEEMGHNFQMKTIRGFAFVLSKLMKQLFTGIYVNEDGIRKIKQLVPDYPILFMPTHRSYVDFLLVSYLCFMFNLPLPTIAAGIDFLAMKGTQIFLRSAGAFFIRRSFGNNHLYRNIFTEYVQAHVLNGDFPVEFFVEGTRSRTAKSLFPKLGFLMAALEPFFKSQVADIVIVPINITYERTLEEKLYTYELLGVPKPKESTQGLVKARQILNECYGTIHVHLDNPIILSEFCAQNKFKRNPHPGPRYLSPLVNDERRICKDLATHVIRRNQLNSTITPFVLIASVLLVHLQKNRFQISIDELTKEVIKLKTTVCLLGAKVVWNEKIDVQDEIKKSIIIHNSIIRIDSNHCTYVRISQIDPSTLPADLTEGTMLKGHTLQNKTVCCVAPYIFCSHYSNQLLHMFVGLAFILIPLRSANLNRMTQDELFSKYHFLESIFLYDFIFETNHTKENFSRVLNQLCKLDLIITENNEIAMNTTEDKLITIICHLIEPFLIGYKIVCQVLLMSRTKDITSSSVVRESQAYAERKFLENKLFHCTVFSLDLINNALLGLINYGAVIRDRRNQENVLNCVHPVLIFVAEELDQLINCPLLFDAEVNRNVPSKL